MEAGEANKKMPKLGGKAKGTIVGAIGATMIGGAILLFVVTMILNNLKAVDPGGPDGAEKNASWADFNSTVDTISTILTVCVILLAVLGIVLIGSQMIAIIGGGFGG